MVDLLERGLMYPPLDICVDARAVYDAVAAADACELAESNLGLHLISVRDRMAYGLIREPFWVDARDVIADGFTQGGIDRLLVHSVSNDCKHQAIHEALVHQKHMIVGSATIPHSFDSPRGGVAETTEAPGIARHEASDL